MALKMLKIYMKQLEDMYINFAISSFSKIEMTKLSKVTGNSHDVFTKHLLLNDSLDDEKTLWKSIKPFLRDYENEDNACIIIDDMLMHKPWSKVNDETTAQYNLTKQSI